MIKLIMSEEDRDILMGILDGYYTELRGEISNTENWTFKEKLKKEEQVILRVLDGLKKPVKS